MYYVWVIYKLLVDLMMDMAFDWDLIMENRETWVYPSIYSMNINDIF